MNIKLIRFCFAAQAFIVGCTFSRAAAAAPSKPYSREVQGDNSLGVYLESRFSDFASSCGLPEFKYVPGLFSSAYKVTTIPSAFFSTTVARPVDHVLSFYPSIAVLHMPKIQVSSYFTAFFPTSDPENALKELTNKQMAINNLLDGIDDSSIKYLPGSEFTYNNTCQDSLDAAEEAGVDISVIKVQEKVAIKRNRSSSIYFTHATFVSPLSRLVYDSIGDSVSDAVRERFQWNVAAWYAINSQYVESPWFISQVELASISTTIGQNAVSAVDSSGSAGANFPLYSVNGEIKFVNKQSAVFDSQTQATFVFGSPVSSRSLFADPVTKRYYSPTSMKLATLQSAAKLQNQLAKAILVGTQEQTLGSMQALEQEVFFPNMSRAACAQSNFKAVDWKIAGVMIGSGIAGDSSLQSVAHPDRDGCLVKVSGSLSGATPGLCAGAGCNTSYVLKVNIGSVNLSYPIASYLKVRTDLSVSLIDQQPRLALRRSSADVLARKFYWTVPLVFVSSSKRSVDATSVRAKADSKPYLQCIYHVQVGSPAETRERVFPIPLVVEYDEEYALGIRANGGSSGGQLKVGVTMPDDPDVNSLMNYQSMECSTSNVVLEAKVAAESVTVSLSVPSVSLRPN